jgi:tRNA pseudouridine55 synthase
MDGIILIDKPAGISSAEVVRRIKSKVKPARVGHLGTLDPFATGVLPILVGEATKLAPLLGGGDKEYAGVIKLGVETDTLDRDGKPVHEAPVPEIGAAKLGEVTARFTGRIEQTPPVFSAIKRGGVRLYRLARKGVEVEPPASRPVEVKRLSLEAVSGDLLRFSALCSTGTYVRSLARDIAVALGTAGHLYELRRLRTGDFAIADTEPLADVLKGLGVAARVCVIGLREALPHLPEVGIDASLEGRVRNGDARALDGLVPAGASMLKVVRDGRLVAVAKATSRATAAIVRVFGSSTFYGG